MNHKNREQLLAGLAITAVLLLVGDSFVLKPLTASWKARAARIAALEEKVVAGTEKLKNAETLQAKWNSMSANTLTNEISAAESQALRAFERWSRDANVTISGLKPQWKRSNSTEDYQTLECRADATGSLASLARFLYQVEKDPLAMKVDVVDLTARDVEGRNLTLALQLSGLVLTPKKVALTPKKNEAAAK